jgi:eukaryotic-like serine/threonine-protein kinase
MKEAGQLVGQLLDGKYRVQQLLALGGMGFVYAGRHEVTGRAVALKLLRPELAARPDLVERVSLEARLAVEASHPNVVQVLDVGADDRGVPYLVLERLYGLPLEAVLDPPLSLRSTLEAVVPVINALATLHGAGIVHRDIKPSNIFLSRDERGQVTPKLLDFGIAKALQSSGSTLTGVALGTPAYMAPEQLLSCNAASPASDVWSMAVVCVRCLTGRWPFAEMATRGLASLRAGLHPSELEGVPQPIAEVLSAALQPDPAERPANALELRARLFAALSELTEEKAWPGETSVSFAEPDSQLARALSASLARANGHGLAASRTSARPGHLVTRTLSRVWSSVPMRRASSVASLAVLVAVGLGYAAFVTLRAPVPSEELELQSTRALQASSPSMEEHQAELHWPGRAKPGAALFDEASPTQAAPNVGARGAPALSLKAPPASRGRREAPSSRNASQPMALEANASEPNAKGLPGSLVVGANRSPIIE